MIFRLILLAVLTYFIASVNSSMIISRNVFQNDVRHALSYSRMFELHNRKGVIYLVAVEFFKAMVVVIIGGLCLRGPGFPSVGKLTAVLISLLAQARPFFNGFKPYRNVVWPALLVLMYDWRICLICVVVFAVAVAVTRLVSLGACAAAAAFPILVAIFGGWWLKILLALMCAAAVIYIYRSGLMRFLAKMKKEPSPKEDGPAAAAA
ncbi:MAG: glycerol-3-phosphate acyltransferase, partial [Oscillospiraceae bacterium]|nr:glycerol-3-phosphate acyltransferase [Oscillospiraceae bacterium]